jgi:hypothetical protein
MSRHATKLIRASSAILRKATQHVTTTDRHAISDAIRELDGARADLLLALERAHGRPDWWCDPAPVWSHPVITRNETANGAANPDGRDTSGQEGA